MDLNVRVLCILFALVTKMFYHILQYIAGQLFLKIMEELSLFLITTMVQVI